MSFLSKKAIFSSRDGVWSHVPEHSAGEYVPDLNDDAGTAGIFVSWLGRGWTIDITSDGFTVSKPSRRRSPSSPEDSGRLLFGHGWPQARETDGTPKSRVLCPERRPHDLGCDHIPDDWKNMVCDECQDPGFQAAKIRGLGTEQDLRHRISDPPPRRPWPLKPCGVWTEHPLQAGSWDNQRWPHCRNSPPVSTSISELAPGSLLISSGTFSPQPSFSDESALP